MVIKGIGMETVGEHMFSTYDEYDCKKLDLKKCSTCRCIRPSL